MIKLLDQHPIRPQTDTTVPAVPAGFGVGHAVQTSHWGEVVQNGLEHGGRLITAAITLPRSDRFAETTFQVERDGPLTVEPPHALKAQRAARWTLRLAGLPGLGGRLQLGGNIRPGCGGGSSTADIIASIRAVCAAVRFHLSDEAIQRLCWEIEGASDPLALVAGGEAVVYGTRTGEIVRRLGRSLPPMVSLGFNSAPGEMVLTESLVGREGYTAGEVRDFQAILALAEEGVALRRPDLVGTAATASARLNQGRVPTRNFEQLVRLGAEVGALGLSVSHSGTVAALLFGPDSPDLPGRLRAASTTLSDLGCDDVESFRLGVETETAWADDGHAVPHRTWEE